MAALFGALLPDLSLYLTTGWSLYIRGIAPEVVFGHLYSSDAWQAVFAVDNSIPLWGLVLAAALLLRSPVGVAFAGAGLLHLAFDFPLHHDDAWRHFWPLSDWVSHSPFSYWDRARHGEVIGALETGACMALCALLWNRFRTRLANVLITLALLAEAAPSLIFARMFR